MQATLSNMPLGAIGASSTSLLQQTCSAASSSKQLTTGKSKIQRASMKTSNSTIGGSKTNQRRHRENKSQTETESEDEGNIEEEESEEKKYERKLNRSMRTTMVKQRYTPLSSSNLANTQQMDKNNVNETDLHHSKRPKRAGASTNRYFNYDQTAGNKHEHSHYQLVSYFNYKSLAAQPFIVYISVEAQLILNVHSHLSEYEVIGFLGGYCFESQTSNQKYLIISTVIPCDSLIENQVERQKNVDLCPISATNARQIIQSRGQQVLGWYHSHPFFPVEPSMIDIRNHAVYQKNFDLENLPFVALIIGPYSVKNRNDSLMKVFHLVKEKQPFSLTCKQMPTKKLRRAVLVDLKEIFHKYKTHKDKINMKDKWYAGQTREDKLITVIEGIVQKNLRTRDRIDFHQDISTNLSSDDYLNFTRDNYVPQPKRKTLEEISRQSSGRFGQDLIEEKNQSESDDWSEDDLMLASSNKDAMAQGSLGTQSASQQHNSGQSFNRNQMANHFSTGTTGTTLESNIINSNISVESLQLGASSSKSKKKESFSIDSDDQVQKLMHRVKVILKKELFDEDYVSSDED